MNKEYVNQEVIENEKISIVVPVYNVEAYLRRCVKSLLNQTYKNIEIILVNDGSPDNSGQICDDFAIEDDRVKVVHKPNGGLCSARNAALDVATGDYIGFIDSDDMVDEDMFECLLKNAKEYSAEISCCGYYRVLRKKTRIVVGKEFRVYNSEEAIEELVTKWTIRTIFCNKLFKKELFDNLRFPEDRVFESTYLMHRIFQMAKKIVYIPEPKYYYFSIENSIVNTPSIKNQADYVTSHISRYYDLHEDYPQLKYHLMEFVVRESVKLVGICYIRRSEIKSNQDKLEIIGNFLSENYDYILKMNITNKSVMTKVKYLITLSKTDLYVAWVVHVLGRKYKKLKKKQKKWDKTLRKKLFKRKSNKSFAINMQDFTTRDHEIFNKLHQKQLEIMDEFVRVCDKFDLKYYLYGGTLLGAVRHDGFIPWDDDMDIVMPRADYEKFAEYCKTEMDEKYFFQTCFTDPNFPKLFAKIRLNNSYVEEKGYENVDLHEGIFIDILPLDNFPTDMKKGRKILNKFAWLNMICNQEKISPTLYPHKFILFYFYKMLPQAFNYNRRQKLLEEANSYQGENICSFGSHYRPFIRRVLKKAWFEGDEYMTFEGRQYRVPSGWKEYLIHLYGESYMELPPVEKRVNHFNFYTVEFKTNNKRGKNI